LARYYWDDTDTFEKEEVIINGQKYAGYALFQRVMKYVFEFHFPEYVGITEHEAREKGIYPAFAWRNYGGRMEWAKNHNGYLAELDQDHNGELRKIYYAAEQAVSDMKKYRNNITQEIVLGYLGIPLLGCRKARVAEVCDLGHWAGLGSSSLSGDGYVHGLGARCDRVDAASRDCYFQWNAVSGVVVSNT